MVFNPTLQEWVYSNNKFFYKGVRANVSIFGGKFCIEIQNYSQSVQKDCLVLYINICERKHHWIEKGVSSTHMEQRLPMLF